MPDTPAPTLAELIDLECQLLADRGRDAAELRERDESIARRVLGDDPLPRRAEIFRRWLGALPPGEGPSPGQRLQAYYRLIGVACAVAAFVAGAGTASALLDYDGGDPVNIIGFVAVFAGLQLALVTISMLFMMPRRWFGWLPGSGAVHDLLRHVGHRRSGLQSLLGGTVGGEEQAALVAGRMRSWQAVYGEVERWTLAALTQRSALSFNVGALATCFYLVSVSALAFAWSTTLDVDVETMTHVLQTLAAPWSWLPQAVPDADLVAASRYFPGASYDGDVLGDWWPFLLATVGCYGVLPRLMLAAFATHRARRSRAALGLDHADCQALYERLLRGRRGFPSGDRIPGAPGAAREEHDGAAGRELPAADSSRRCVIVRWADTPLDEGEAASVIAASFGWGQPLLRRAGDSSDPSGAAVVEELRHESRAFADAPVVVAAEAWEVPAKGLLRFLSELRAAMGRERAIVVGLLAGQPGQRREPTSHELAVWARRVGSLGDAYLRVEVLVSR